MSKRKRNVIPSLCRSTWLSRIKNITILVFYDANSGNQTTENAYNIDGTVSTCTNTLLHPYDGHNDSHVYTYDAAGRLVGETVSYEGGEPVTVQQLSYNAIGQLAANDLGAFTEAYTYNVRGAMTGRKSDVFEQTISFSNHFDRLYNGSIGMITDKLTGGKSTSSGYSYDNAGRLTSAMIFLDGITRPTGYTYDLNGNITALNRRGYNPSYVAELIDDLVYQYDGNQVRKITEKAPVVISEKTMNFVDGADEDVEYTYDRNGNMTSDANKGLTMTWDANNRLSKVENYVMTMSFGRTGSGTKLSKNVYTGPKLNPTYPGLHRSNSLGGYPFFPRDSVPVFPGDSVISVNTTTLTEYFGAYEYENGKFSRLNTATGYRDSLGVHVYVRDWQGNIRAVVRRNAQGVVELEQATYYYPYGMPMAESTNPTINRYKYTGKELLTDKGVNLMDYGARFYDPTSCLWLSPDPLSPLMPDKSAYKFCNNNPIRFSDPTGMYEIEEEARKASVRFGNASVLRDKKSGEWFLALNERGTGAYTGGETLTRYFGHPAPIPGVANFFINLGVTYGKETQYSTTFEIWRGKNGKIYNGLSGRGPNQHTGSRKAAEKKMKKIGKVSNVLTLLSMGMVYDEYKTQAANAGPNMKKYLKRKFYRDETFNASGLGNIYATAASLGYNLGYLIEDFGQWITDDPNFRIRVNPYTNDFTPIEQTLQEADELGIEIY